MADIRIGVIINGATGRMGTTQHMANLLAIAREGGLPLGNGDMLMIPPGSSDLMRVHGGFVTETEIARVVNLWKAQGKPQYNEAILRALEAGQTADAEALARDHAEQMADILTGRLRVVISRAA